LTSGGSSRPLATSLALEEARMRTYIQQYGKERTGTNYLKALLATNFTDIVLFDNRLGSKHEHFRTVGAWMEGRAIFSQERFEDLLRTDEYWRRRNIPTLDPFRWVHQPVEYEELLSLRDGLLNLHYVVSIKSPYAFAISINRWKRSQLRRFHECPSVDPLDLPYVLEQCAEFNRVYRSYWPLIETGKAVLARYEDLLTDYSAILRQMQDKFGLTAKHPEFLNISSIVAPTIGISQLPFYKSYYEDRLYLAALSKEARAAICNAIDWDLMRYYCYHPDEEAPPTSERAAS
jgi:hypothetical protein